MEYNVTIVMKEIYEGYVEANSIEEAEELAYKALKNEELSLIIATSDVLVEPEE
jgi:hypothetical protein